MLFLRYISLMWGWIIIKDTLVVVVTPQLDFKLAHSIAGMVHVTWKSGKTGRISTGSRLGSVGCRGFVRLFENVFSMSSIWD